MGARPLRSRLPLYLQAPPERRAARADRLRAARHLVGIDALYARHRLCRRRTGLRNTGVLVLDERLRVPHILSLSFPQGMPAGLVEKLAGEKIYVAPRLGRLRISPHVYNDEEDVDRFVAVLRKLIA